MFRVKIVLQLPKKRLDEMCALLWRVKSIHRKRSKQDWKLLWASKWCML